jgi:hypothetical protein
VLLWACVLIRSIRRRGCGPRAWSPLPGRGIRGAGQAWITWGSVLVAGLGVTSTSKKTGPPFRPTVQHPVIRMPHDHHSTTGQEILVDQEMSLTRSWRVVERVSERVTATLLTGCGKGSPRPSRHATRRTTHDNPRTRPIPRRARRNPLPMAVPTRRTTRIPSRPTRPLPVARRRGLDQPTDG